MQAGKLNRRITIQAPTKVYDKGQQIETWTDVATVWSSVRTISSTAGNTDALIQIDSPTEFVIRYLPNITNEMKIVYKTKSYRITGIINEDENDRKIVITATRIL